MHCSMLTKRMEMSMNEMWRRMALTLFLCALLFSTCWGQGNLTTTMTTVSYSTQTSPGSPTVSSTTNNTNSPRASTSNNQASDPPSTTTNKVLQSSNTAIPTTSTTESQADTTTISDGLIHKIHTTSQALKNEGYTNDHKITSTKNQSAKEEKPEVQKSEQAPVFVSILVSGLILAAALIGVYVWKNHCHTKTNGMKLAEESYMAEEDNQGNTLVSVAPLNPPETQEKPSQNGESLEAVKPQNPPAATNGHSTTKADTEL